LKRELKTAQQAERYKGAARFRPSTNAINTGMMNFADRPAPLDNRAEPLYFE
jgi:hypothetical protein